MPTVKWFFGSGLASSSNTVLAIDGSNSLDDRPYRPPMTLGMAGNLPAATSSVRAVTTS